MIGTQHTIKGAATYIVSAGISCGWSLKACPHYDPDSVLIDDDHEPTQLQSTLITSALDR